MDISIICVPYHIDIARWGCAQGPQAFLDQGLRQLLEARGHTVSGPVWIELPRSERTRDSVTNLGRITQRTAAAVRVAVQQEDGLVLVLEGDCTHAVGAIGGLAQAMGNPGVVWFDAHGDLHTMETTTSGFLGGMPYAVALGWDLDDWRLAAGLEPAVRPEAAVLVGGSDLDREEIVALEHFPILHVSTREMSRSDGAEHVRKALHSRADEVQSWYLHLDLDVGGPEVSPGGLTPALSWPPSECILAAVRATTQTLPVKVASLAVYNPAADVNGNGIQFGLNMAAAVVDGMTSV